MNDDESNELYTHLQRIARQQGLEWVVTQVEGEIRRGKSEEKPVQRGKGKTRRHDFYRSTTPFSPQERVGLLAKGIQRAVVDVSDMQEELPDLLAPNPNRPVNIVFQPDEIETAKPATAPGTLAAESEAEETDDGKKELNLPPADKERRGLHRKRLRELLNELMERTHANANE
jgi:hypothetical protein